MVWLLSSSNVQGGFYLVAMCNVQGGFCLVAMCGWLNNPWQGAPQVGVGGKLLLVLYELLYSCAVSPQVFLGDSSLVTVCDWHL